ncbi:MAG TPA: TetR/AcrR family transcriptional regulator [Acidimicrobiales bacterium]|nr:TetR/AcrR family transcriptional regulator [Acidimicrobiales bacterium]
MTATGVLPEATAEAVADRPQGHSHQEQRVVDAALRCIARWGVAKTTLDDVAREAGWSRATVYRLFPGGKDAVLETVAEVELERFFSALDERLSAASDLEDLLVGGMSEAGARITGHPALQFLVIHEPELILPQISFDRAERVLARAASFAAPYLTRWLVPEEANRVGEWVTRIVISYAASPSATVDVADTESVRRLVRSFVLPGIRASVDTQSRVRPVS